MQASINTNKDGSIDKVKYRKYIDEIKEEGYELINDYEEELEGGMQIKYLVKDEKGIDKFRSGGWVTQINNNYLVFRSHAGPLFSLQYENIVELYGLKKEDKKIKLKKPDESLKYKVEYEGVLIFSSDRKDRIDRFKKSKKYENIIGGSKYKFSE